MIYEVRERTLSEIADVTMGQSPKGETCNLDGVGLPLLNGPTEFGFRHPDPVQFTTDPKRFADPGDLLFCVRGSTTGRMNWADRRYAIGRGIAGIRGENGYPTSYVRAVIEHQLDSLLQGATGSTFPNVGRRMLTDLPVPEHDVPTAVGIAKLLDAFDDRIWSLLKANTTLESIAQAVFKSWFIDFDPVHAKVAGHEPIGMDAETAALFATEFEESELGPIPAGWDMRTVSEIGTVITGKTPSTREMTYYGSDVPFITIPDMHDATFVEYTGRSLSNFGAASQQAKMLPPLSVCVSCIATPGLVSLTAAPSQTNQQINSIICNDDVSPYYAYLYMKQLREHLIVLGSGGSATLNVNKGQFEKISLLIPSSGIMEEFARVVQPLFNSILNNIRLARTLGNLRDTLLPRLISGRLRIPEAEEIEQEAVS